MATTGKNWGPLHPQAQDKTDEAGEDHPAAGAPARALSLPEADPDGRGAAGQPLPPGQGGGRALLQPRPGGDLGGQRLRAGPQDVVGPLIRNLGSMLVRGVQPREVMMQYMAKGDSPTGGKDGNTHFGDPERAASWRRSPCWAPSSR